MRLYFTIGDNWAFRTDDVLAIWLAEETLCIQLRGIQQEVEIDYDDEEEAQRAYIDALKAWGDAAAETKGLTE